MNQNSRLLTALLNGHRVTRLKALFDLRIQNITARITELRNLGVDLTMTNRVDATGADYAEYTVSANERDRLFRLTLFAGTYGYEASPRVRVTRDSTGEYVAVV